VLEEVSAWQGRGLDATYAIVFFDAIRVKIRNEGMVSNRAVYLAIGLRCSGHKEILGIWIEQTEGAKFWLRVMSELRNRRGPGHPDRGGREDAARAPLPS
jgi:putative transposase